MPHESGAGIVWCCKVERDDAARRLDGNAGRCVTTGRQDGRQARERTQQVRVRGRRHDPEKGDVADVRREASQAADC